MRTLLLPALVSAAFLDPVAAQTPAADGPLPGLQLAFSIDPATAVGIAGVREAQPYWKRTGSRTAVPPPTSATTVDFAPAVMFGPYMGAPYPDIDAMSLGLDPIPANFSGEVSVDFGHWNFMAFSVRRGTLGSDGSAIRAEVGTPGGNEADVFHYVFRGASCIHPDFIDRTFKLADSTEIALPTPAEVDAADLTMNLYPLDGVLTPSLGLPACPLECPTVFYSFAGSPANLARIPASWWGSNVPSGAAIFSSTWTGASWTPPAVAHTPAALGLLDCEDVDGLAIDLFDTRYGAGPEILFSTTSQGCVLRDQILFLRCGCDFGTPVAFRYSNGDLVSRRIGVDGDRPDDDVDAICIGDPICSGRHFWEKVSFERTIGYPWSGSSTFGLPRGLGLSTLREPLSVGAGYAYKLFTVGGHPGGPGAWLLWSPVGYPFSPPLQAFFAVPTISPFPGNPVQPVLTFPAAMAGVDVVIQAATLNLSPPLVHVSHAQRILLH